MEQREQGPPAPREQNLAQAPPVKEIAYDVRHMQSTDELQQLLRQQLSTLNTDLELLLCDMASLPHTSNS